ncbi:MAG TPA: DUF420 domain-containing protein [Pirellulaceae bacterium]|nr:DUF420 domain-containing protein [Pirellulaceae bacterium]
MLLLLAESMLPHLNVSLNATATVLLLIGFALIRNRREAAHRWVMLSCFGVSMVFLVTYLLHKYWYGDTKFPADQYPLMAWVYYPLLASHVVLAMAVPILALTTIVLGLRDRRAAHRRWARITFPIWLYVSVTGILVYLFLYQWFR